MAEIKLVLDGAEEPEEMEAPAKELAVTTEQVLTEVEKLSDEEKAQIEEFADKIDLHKSEIVTNYGSTIQKQSAAIATKTLNDVKTKNTGEISGLLVEMVAAMDGMEGSQRLPLQYPEQAQGIRQERHRPQRERRENSRAYREAARGSQARSAKGHRHARRAV